MKNAPKLEQLSEGLVSEIELTIAGELESVIVLREAARVQAWLNVCPHAGRRLDYAPGEFLRTPDGLLMCAVHGATFDLADGRCVGGPCIGASLTPVQLEVDEAGVLHLAE